MATWEVKDEEFESVLHQSAGKQYDYFVHKTADWGEVWLLRRGDSEYAMSEDLDGGEGAVAVWPHPRYAEACREAGSWADHDIVAMATPDFVDGMLASMIEDGIQVAVLPLPDGRVTPVTARKLRSDLDAELELY